MIYTCIESLTACCLKATLTMPQTEQQAKQKRVLCKSTHYHHQWMHTLKATLQAEQALHSHCSTHMEGKVKQQAAVHSQLFQTVKTNMP